MDELIRVIEQKLPHLHWSVRTSDTGNAYYAHIHAPSVHGAHISRGLDDGFVSHDFIADTPWDALNGAYCKAIAAL